MSIPVKAILRIQGEPEYVIGKIQDQLQTIVGPFMKEVGSRGKFVAVPKNSSAVGSPGDYSGDTGFFYICIAPNTWRRVAVVAF